MKSNISENNKNSVKEICDEVQMVCIQGADELRKKLSITESSHDWREKLHNGRGRAWYIYSVLDEVEKLGMAVLRISEMLGDFDKHADDDDIGKRLIRNLLTSIHDEQALYIRRLTEVLVGLICFSKTNRNEYFDHYLLYRELEQCIKRKEDLKFYYECLNKNIQARIDLSKRSITEAEKRLQLSACWYLQNDKKTNSPKPNGESKFASNFQDLLKMALSLATKDEQVAIGMDYEGAFRQTSRDIHLNIGGMKPNVTYDRLVAQCLKFAMLSSLCLLRCRRLLRIRSSQGIIASIARNYPFKDITKTTYKSYTNPGITKGDFVSVGYLLGEVIETKKSSFGYRCFRIRFLSDHFLKEDWVIAPEVRLQFKGKKLSHGVYKRLDGGTVKPKLVKAQLRENALALWQQYINARTGRQSP